MTQSEPSKCPKKTENMKGDIQVVGDRVDLTKIFIATGWEITFQITTFRAGEGGKTPHFPPPSLEVCSGHFEKKVANETTHNIGVADQKILSDSNFNHFL